MRDTKNETQPMIFRVAYLYWLNIKTFLHRLRYDLINEIVVAISASVLFGLFFYIVNDFLNIKIQSISEIMRQKFGEALAILLILLVNIPILKINRKKFDPHASFDHFLRRLGEEPFVITALFWLRLVTTVILFYAIGWFIVLKYLIVWPLAKMIWIQILSASILTFLFFCQDKFVFKTKHSRSSLLFISGHKVSKVLAMVHWRLVQLVFRGRITRLCLGVSGGFFILICYLAFVTAPFFMVVLAGFMASLFTTTAMAYQISDDIKYAWAERLMGISHKDVLKAYFLIGLILGGVIGIFCCLSYIFFTGDLSSANLVAALKVLLIGALCPITLPALMFQIDPNRPILQIIISLLIGLFLVTAIYAHLLSILVWPVVVYYAMAYQDGRFYRA